MSRHHIDPDAITAVYVAANTAFSHPTPAYAAAPMAPTASDFCPHRQVPSPVGWAPPPEPDPWAEHRRAQARHFGQALLYDVQNEVLVGREQQRRDSALAETLLRQLEEDFSTPVPMAPEREAPDESGLAAIPMGGFDEEDTVISEPLCPLDEEGHAEVVAMGPWHRRVTRRVLGWLGLAA